jgi:hypothetical protein
LYNVGEPIRRKIVNQTKWQRIMQELKDKKLKVVKVSKSEFELDSGDIYPIPFDLGYEPSLAEFQKFVDDSRDLILDFIRKSQTAKKGKKNG